MNKPFKRQNSKLWQYLLLSPSLAGMLAFFILPFGYMIYLSFLSKPVNGEFVGLANYRALFESGAYAMAVRNTLIFSCLSIPLIVVLSMILAALINQRLRLGQVARRSVIIPLIIPVASVVLFFELLFNNKGVINGFFNANIDWLGGPLSVVVVVLLFLWKNLGYNIILFLAGLQAIPKSYYEIATLEGAGSIKRFFMITMVYLAPTTFFVFVLSIINSFKVFRELYLLKGNYPNKYIYLLQHFMNNMFRKLDYGKLVAAALIMALVIGVLVVIMFYYQRKISDAIGE